MVFCLQWFCIKKKELPISGSHVEILHILCTIAKEFGKHIPKLFSLWYSMDLLNLKKSDPYVSIYIYQKLTNNKVWCVGKK